MRVYIDLLVLLLGNNLIYCYKPRLGFLTISFLQLVYFTQLREFIPQ